MARVHGGRLVAQALRRHGVQHVFTLCGGHVQAIYDGCIDEGIQVIDTRHEQTAGHAAEGMARMSGRPGVALVGAGPGTTNVVTALANARRAGLPLVCIGGTGPQELSDLGAYQDFDSARTMAKVSKWAARVTSASRLMEYVDMAFNRARAGAPGPVYLEIPLDVLMAFAEDEPPLTAPQEPARPAPAEADLLALSEMLRRAGKPVFLLGSQLRTSPLATIVERFCDKVQVPIYLNGMARGALAQDHECLFLHTRKEALKQADLVVLCGTPFDFRVEYGRKEVWNPDAKVVQVNLEAEVLGHNRAVDLAMHADTGLMLDALLSRVGRKSCPGWLASLRQLEAEQKSAIEAAAGNAAGPPSATRLCLEVQRRLGAKDTLIADGGEFAARAAQVMAVRWPQVWMDAGPLGSYGVGPGFAMAAALAHPEERAVIMTDDAAFGYHAMEFEALVRHKLNVVAVIGNDAGFTQTRKSQIQLYGEERVVASRLTHSHYEKVAEAMGGRGYWVEEASELPGVLDEAFSQGAPACVNVKLAAEAAS